MPDLKGKERIDVTGFGTVKIIQDPDEFCYGVDAVILADIAARRGKAIKEESRVMDLGTGSGIIPLILSHNKNAVQNLFGRPGGQRAGYGVQSFQQVLIVHGKFHESRVSFQQVSLRGLPVIIK